jgi:hypothetical protein
MRRPPRRSAGCELGRSVYQVMRLERTAGPRDATLAAKSNSGQQAA